MKTRFAMLLVFCLVMLLTCRILPARSIEYVEPMPNPVSVDIIGDDRGNLGSSDDSGNSLSIEAKRGERFSIRVRNNSNRRVALAISVDGRNIISGEKSFNRPGESMYVLRPWQSTNFEGWRSSYDQVQRFYFTDETDSYSGKMGDYSQMGWIKVAAYRERQYYPQPRYLEDSAMAPSMEKRAESSQAGTGYGEGTHSPVATTEFTPENFAAQLISIKYNWPGKYYFRPDEPSPVYQDGFAKPPR